MSRINPNLLKVRAAVQRRVSQPDGRGGWRETTVAVGQIMCRVTDAALVERTDQQGRLGTDLVRTLYCMPGENLRPGDRVIIPGLELIVESVSTQSDGAYMKALVTEDSPS